MGDENTKDSKKPYTPPQFTVINLRPQEAVLGTCKSPSAGGPGNGTCNALGVGCQFIGS